MGPGAFGECLRPDSQGLCGPVRGEEGQDRTRGYLDTSLAVGGWGQSAALFALPVTVSLFSSGKPDL